MSLSLYSAHWADEGMNHNQDPNKEVMPEQSHFREPTLPNIYVFSHLIDSQLQCSYHISHQLARILILVKRTSGHFREGLKPTFLFDEDVQ